MLIDAVRREAPNLDNLRIREINADKFRRVVNVTVSFPTQLADSDKQRLIELFSDEVGKQFSVVLKAEIDFFDEISAKKFLMLYIRKNAPSLFEMKDSDVIVRPKDGYAFSAVFNVDRTLAEYINSTNLFKNISAAFTETTCYRFLCSVNVIQGDDEQHLNRLNEDMQFAIGREILKPRRFTSITCIKKYFGKLVRSKPSYICDVNEQKDFCCVAGKIVEKKVFQSKKENSDEMDICKLTLQDYSEKINCVLFLRYKIEDAATIAEVTGKNEAESAALAKRHQELNNRQKLMLSYLHEGDEVVVEGKANFSDYSKAIEIVVYNLSKCSIMPLVEQPKYGKEVPKQYVRVKPQSILSYRQDSFVKNDASVPEALNGEIVVLFVNTTGNRVLQDKIIQIGAVKIRNGMKVLSFYTTVNTETDVGDEFLAEIGETETRCKRSPTFVEVCGDLYKFCYGSKIATMGVQTTMSFVQYNSTPVGYMFSNQTVELSELFSAYFDLNGKVKRPDCSNLSAVATSLGFAVGKTANAYAQAELSAKILTTMCE